MVIQRPEVRVDASCGAQIQGGEAHAAADIRRDRTLVVQVEKTVHHHGEGSELSIHVHVPDAETLLRDAGHLTVLVGHLALQPEKAEVVPGAAADVDAGIELHLSILGGDRVELADGHAGVLQGARSQENGQVATRLSGQGKTDGRDCCCSYQDANGDDYSFHVHKSPSMPSRASMYGSTGQSLTCRTINQYTEHYNRPCR